MRCSQRKTNFKVCPCPACKVIWSNKCRGTSPHKDCLHILLNVTGNRETMEAKRGIIHFNDVCKLCSDVWSDGCLCDTCLGNVCLGTKYYLCQDKVFKETKVRKKIKDNDICCSSCLTFWKKVKESNKSSKKIKDNYDEYLRPLIPTRPIENAEDQLSFIKVSPPTSFPSDPPVFNKNEYKPIPNEVEATRVQSNKTVATYEKLVPMCTLCESMSSSWFSSYNIKGNDAELCDNCSRRMRSSKPYQMGNIAALREAEKPLYNNGLEINSDTVDFTDRYKVNNGDCTVFSYGRSSQNEKLGGIKVPDTLFTEHIEYIAENCSAFFPLHQEFLEKDRLSLFPCFGDTRNIVPELYYEARSANVSMGNTKPFQTFPNIPNLLSDVNNVQKKHKKSTCVVVMNRCDDLSTDWVSLWLFLIKFFDTNRVYLHVKIFGNTQAPMTVKVSDLLRAMNDLSNFDQKKKVSDLSMVECFLHGIKFEMDRNIRSRHVNRTNVARSDYSLPSSHSTPPSPELFGNALSIETSSMSKNPKILVLLREDEQHPHSRFNGRTFEYPPYTKRYPFPKDWKWYNRKLFDNGEPLEENEQQFHVAQFSETEHLKVDSSRKTWTPDELAALKEGNAEHGTRWVRVLQNPNLKERLKRFTNMDLGAKWAALQKLQKKK